LRILVVMQYPGYLRYFDETIRALALRGHEIVVVFDNANKQAEGLRALEGMPPEVSVGDRFPRRKDRWAGFALGLRHTTDYARYLHPRLADATFLRRRIEKLPRGLGWLARIHRLPAAVVRPLLLTLRFLEDAIPSSREIEKYLRRIDADVLVVTPLVTQASRQTELVKSARALGLPSVLCVASWDHLTTKGTIRSVPDRVVVWNETQVEEATSLHYVPADRLFVTGAQPFDRWFERRPSLSRAEFHRKVGLATEAPFVLFTGSTASISAPDAERRFVRRWVQALRASDDPALRGIPVLIRPHPYNPGDWSGFAEGCDGDVAVWPHGGANPVDEHDRDDYFHSLFYSCAVVGINTSAMIEAAIVGRPVHTVRSPEFAETQEQTLHFHYLRPEHGGFLEVGETLDDHVKRLARTLRTPELATERLRSFVASFVRPRGLDAAATEHLVAAIEDAAASAAAPGRPTVGTRLVRGLLAAVLVVARPPILRAR
jgi:hypothetical protein